MGFMVRFDSGTNVELYFDDNDLCVIPVVRDFRTNTMKYVVRRNEELRLNTEKQDELDKTEKDE